MRVELAIGSGIGRSTLDMVALPRIGEHVEIYLRGEHRRFEVIDVIHRIEVDDRHLGWRRPEDLVPLVLFKEISIRPAEKAAQAMS